MDPNTTPCQGGAKLPVMVPGLPPSLSAPWAAQRQAHSEGEHRRELLPCGWGSLFWKVFLEASSGSPYTQVLCLIIASISWQIYCLTANSPSLLHHW